MFKAKNPGLTLVQFRYDKSATPLGALYLTYGLDNAGIDFELKLYPAYAESSYLYCIDNLSSFFADSNNILAIGCWSAELPFVLAALKKIKERSPEKIIVLGGIAPTQAAEEIMRNFSYIDFIIKGCGVAKLPALINKLNQGIDFFSDIPGLVYRKGNRIVSNSYDDFYAGSTIPKSLPYHRLPGIASCKEFPVLTSFGCAHQCTFCTHYSLFGSKIIYRNLSEVIEEIRLIKKIKRGRNFNIQIRDPAFILNRNRVIEFCNLLLLNNLDVRWGCYGRVNCMDEKLLELMAAAGCKTLFYGVESGSNRILKKVKKCFTIEEAIKIALLSKKYMPTVIASFMFNYPFEEEIDFKQTFFTIIYLKTRNITTILHLLLPIKNSLLYRRYHKEIFLSDKIRSIDRCSLAKMPKECLRLIRSYPEIFSYYYSFKHKQAGKFQKIMRSWLYVNRLPS